MVMVLKTAIILAHGGWQKGVNCMSNDPLQLDLNSCRVNVLYTQEVNKEVRRPGKPAFS